MPEKFKVKDIEAESKDDVISFINQTGLNISEYLNTPEKIEIPFKAITITSLFIVLICCSLFWIEDAKWRGVCTILFIALSILNICLVYMGWKNKLLAGIVALGELILFVIALNIYTPKEVVHKIETHIPHQENNK